MSWQTRLLNLVDVLLRVPPLFIIDELFRIGLGVSGTSPFDSDTNITVFQVLGKSEFPDDYIPSNPLQYDTQFYKILFIILAKFILALCGK